MSAAGEEYEENDSSESAPRTRGRKKTKTFRNSGTGGPAGDDGVTIVYDDHEDAPEERAAEGVSNGGGSGRSSLNGEHFENVKHEQGKGKAELRVSIKEAVVTETPLAAEKTKEKGKPHETFRESQDK